MRKNLPGTHAVPRLLFSLTGLASSFLIILFFFNLPDGPRAQSVLEFEQSPTLINFPRKGKEFSRTEELDIWARNRNLLLIPDCSTGGIRNHVAESIPPHGVQFELEAPGEGRAFLYLDLVSFRPLQAYKPFKESFLCNPDRDREFYPDATRLSPRVRWLEVIVNGRVVKTIHKGAGVFIHSPIMITIDREWSQDRKLNVFLRPSPGEGYFAIWDAFVSQYQEDLSDEPDADF